MSNPKTRGVHPPKGTMMAQNREGFRPWMGITFLIGFGFFTMGLMDPLYDTYTPVFIGRFLESKSLIGLVMTLDNIFALFLIPLVSVWSDRSRTPLGRRMPFILVLLPITAIFFGLLPYAASISLGALIALIFALNLAKQSARGPVVALMPDIVPGEYRSEANGVINTMGGLASIVGTLGLARLMDIDIVLPLIGSTKDKLPFPVAGILVVIAVILLVILVKEGKQKSEEQHEEKVPLLASFRRIAKSKDRSALYILISLFFWFLGYQGVLPFIGLYSIDVLGTSKGTAALGAGMVGVAYALFAIPSGYIAHKAGRKRSIRFSLLILAILTVFLFVHDPLTVDLGSIPRLYSFWVLMFLFGVFWVTVVTNSFPMLWQMATWGTIGIYTGLYYTASQLAAILAPLLTGAIIDLAGYRGIFLFCSACMLVANLTMTKVAGGEAHRETSP